jgi:hypothetical protein
MDFADKQKASLMLRKKEALQAALNKTVLPALVEASTDFALTWWPKTPDEEPQILIEIPTEEALQCLILPDNPDIPSKIGTLKAQYRTFYIYAAFF